MADLASLKVADDLKILVKILYIDDAPVPVKVLCDREEVWLSRQAIEAAEHIPAPRVFKRGDWVRWSDSEGEYRHCLVLGKSTHPSSRLLRVDVPCEGVCEIRSDVLEPDEAPE